MQYHVEVLVPLELQKNHPIFGLQKTLGLYDLLILIPGVHCYIVLVFFSLFTNKKVLYSFLLIIL